VHYVRFNEAGDFRLGDSNSTAWAESNGNQLTPVNELTGRNNGKTQRSGRLCESEQSGG